MPRRKESRIYWRDQGGQRRGGDEERTDGRGG